MCVRTLIVSALMMPRVKSLPRSTDPIPGISSCHFRLLVLVHPIGNTLIRGEALLKDPERPIHSEWYGGSIMSLTLSATLGLIRSPMTLHKASYSFG